jgi:hypothetical protein
MNFKKVKRFPRTSALKATRAKRLKKTPLTGHNWCYVEKHRKSFQNRYMSTLELEGQTQNAPKGFFAKIYQVHQINLAKVCL